MAGAWTKNADTPWALTPIKDLQLEACNAAISTADSTKVQLVVQRSRDHVKAFGEAKTEAKLKAQEQAQSWAWRQEESERQRIAEEAQKVADKEVKAMKMAGLSKAQIALRARMKAAKGGVLNQAPKLRQDEFDWTFHSQQPSILEPQDMRSQAANSSNASAHPLGRRTAPGRRPDARMQREAA